MGEPWQKTSLSEYPSLFLTTLSRHYLNMIVRILAFFGLFLLMASSEANATNFDFALNNLRTANEFHAVSQSSRGLTTVDQANAQGQIIVNRPSRSGKRQTVVNLWDSPPRFTDASSVRDSWYYHEAFDSCYRYSKATNLWFPDVQPFVLFNGSSQPQVFRVQNLRENNRVASFSARVNRYTIRGRMYFDSAKRATRLETSRRIRVRGRERILEKHNTNFSYRSQSAIVPPANTCN
jgi:hypothetical protein